MPISVLGGFEMCFSSVLCYSLFLWFFIDWLSLYTCGLFLWLVCLVYSNSVFVLFIVRSRHIVLSCSALVFALIVCLFVRVVKLNKLLLSAIRSCLFLLSATARDSWTDRSNGSGGNTNPLPHAGWTFPWETHTWLLGFIPVHYNDKNLCVCFPGRF